MTRLYLVRHAEAEGNHLRIFHGQTDGKITERGKKQLELLRERMAGEPIDVIWSSPLSRAYDTAVAIRGARELPIHTDPGLMEINGGRWEGMHWKDLDGAYPEESKKWNVSAADVRLPGGESIGELRERVERTLGRIIRENVGKNIAVACHGTPIKIMMTLYSGLPLARMGEIAWYDNTAVSIVDFDGDMAPHVVLAGDSSHLGEWETITKQRWFRENTMD
ncbi:histidine phosphatase family protein [Feifania hominis]|uniref:Histidine phosphatase family protein n=1 Tax=Feifania hominis TaxID=2763660 RepID=A0A926DC22_9FIRM|nr:histidine phosphatase family protein [Feifania hominis]MBC8535117.1 histidine phosphatase family protein [Feifania hominis]